MSRIQQFKVQALAMNRVAFRERVATLRNPVLN